MDWDASGTLIATGGRDKVIKVWDSKSENRRPAYFIQTIASVSRVMWRPGYSSQIAATSLSSDFRIHIWDYTKPFIPQLSLEVHENTPTSILWNGSDYLWSCSKDETFVQNFMDEAYSFNNLFSCHSSSWNPFGELAFTTMTKANSPLESRSSSFPLQRSIIKSNSPRESTSNRTNRQHTGVVSYGGFDYTTFAYLAHYAVLDPSLIFETCQVNAQLALDMNKTEIAQTWYLIQHLYGPNNIIEPRNLSRLYRIYSLEDQASYSQKRVFSFFKDVFSANLKTEDQALPYGGVLDSTLTRDLQEDSSSDDTGEETDDSPTRKHLRKSSLSQALLSNTSPFMETKASPMEIDDSSFLDAIEKPWNPFHLIMDLMDYYSELGDVQMNVFIIHTLKNVIVFPEERVELYTRSYIDLLYRLELWPEATNIINSSALESIRAINGESTALHRSCHTCSTDISLTSRTSLRCESCKNPISQCSFW